MLNLHTVAENLRRELLDPKNSPLPIKSNDYPTLRPFPEAGPLVEYLDTTSLYARERDDVFADLFRLTRNASATAWASRAVLYAFLPGMPHVIRRLRRCAGWVDLDEVVAEALSVTVEILSAFDPDGRSPHIQATLEHVVCRTIFRRRLRRYREMAAESELATFVEHDDGAKFAVTMPFPPTAPNDRDRQLDDDEIALGERMLGEFVSAGRLHAEDANLITETRLRGRTATALSGTLGIDRRTVVRRVDRALDRIGGQLQARLVERMPVSETPLDGCW